MGKSTENGMGDAFQIFTKRGRVVEVKVSPTFARFGVAHPLAPSSETYQASLERGPHMCLLQFDANSYGRFFEVLPEEEENAELIVEDIVSLVLLDLFGEAMVNDVTIHFSLASRLGQRDCSIHIRAQCPSQSFKSVPCTKEYMELAIGNNLSSLLKELFGPITIECVMVQPSLSVWQ
jgi:hypothetical protein